MPDVLVRDLDQTVVDTLKSRAEAHHRSLQMELKTILEQAAKQKSVGDVKPLAEALRARLAGRKHTNSAELVAEDRAR